MIHSIPKLLTAYRSGAQTPSDTVAAIIAARDANPDHAVWISSAPGSDLLKRAAELDGLGDEGKQLPLYGIPFAVKDNIDATGFNTTAGCPAYAYPPEVDAFVVKRLLDAGAILVGKTNMDQFATGLVGTRSPYGAARCVYHKDYISGGSSSGSGVAVARGMVSFALGTDTAGSGRVPAAFNGIVGLKPSKGLLSTSGVVPACRSLDCVSIFAADTDSAKAVLDVAAAFDETDPYSRHLPGATACPAGPAVQAVQAVQPSPSTPSPSGQGVAPETKLTIGVLPKDQRQFFGDEQAAKLYQAAIDQMASLPDVSNVVEIDYAPFAEAAELLYGGPWVAERTHAVGDFIAKNLSACDTAVRGIVLGGRSATAVAAFDAAYRMELLKREAAKAMQDVEIVMLPTTPTIYKVDEVNAEPVQLNTNLGIYNNFMNLLDMCGLTLPAGFRKNNTPFGVTIASTTFNDDLLLRLGKAYEAAYHPAVTKPVFDDWADVPKTIDLAVVGAHLSGMPLNHQLTSRGATLTGAFETSPNYKLYALANTAPPKPGLVRDDSGAVIQVEVWSLTEEAFGSFTAEVPAPLAIGNLELADGRWVKGFVCEPGGLVDAQDITRMGGWRAFTSQSSV